MSLVRLIKEFNIHNNIDEFKKFLENSGIQFEGEVDYYLGSGAFGDVYKVKGKDKVIKVWKASKREIEVNKTIMQHTKKGKLDHVAKTFMIKQVGKDLWLSVMEYLEELPFDIYDYEVESAVVFLEQRLKAKNWEKHNKDVDDYTSKAILNFKGGNDKPEFLEGQFNKINKQYTGRYDDLKMAIFQTLSHSDRYKPSRYLNMLEHYVEFPQFYKDLYDGIQEYNKMGVDHSDIHAGNILQDPKTKNYKLIDPHRS